MTQSATPGELILSRDEIIDLMDRLGKERRDVLGAELVRLYRQGRLDSPIDRGILRRSRTQAAAGQ